MSEARRRSRIAKPITPHSLRHTFRPPSRSGPTSAPFNCCFATSLPPLPGICVSRPRFARRQPADYSHILSRRSPHRAPQYLTSANGPPETEVADVFRRYGDRHRQRASLSLSGAS
jgi:hypothetical protein